jgi:hypothetical protein
MERVDVVELEPAIVGVARACTPVNHDALANPKVHLVIGDGRELLLTTSETYDVIFSEPSNPYRAGIASLFTADFYAAVAERMRPGAVFAQWLQGYELDSQVVRTVYATLGAVFPSVETWETFAGDLLLLATREPIVHDVDRVRARVAAEPYRSALSRIWGMEGAEGFYAGYMATPAFSRAVQASEGRWINTDDRPVLEFGFARNLGRKGLFRTTDLRALVRRRGEDRPPTRGAPLDWDRVDDFYMARMGYWDQQVIDPGPVVPPDVRQRILARRAYLQPSLDEACDLWFAQPEPPRSGLDLLLVGECLASRGDPRLPEYLPRIRERSAVEAELMLALWHSAAGRRAAAADHLIAAVRAFRHDPWPHLQFAQRVLRQSSAALTRNDPVRAAALYEAMSEPFVAHLLDEVRLFVRLELAAPLGRCVEALAPFEPDVPWEEKFLRHRLGCYQRAEQPLGTGHPLTGRARRDLERFLADAPPKLEAGLPPPEVKSTGR